VNRGLLVVFLLAVILVGGILLWGGGVLGGAATESFVFEEVSEQRGLDYVGTADKRATFGNGRAGTYVLDFNGDGWPDLLAIGNNGPVLYENVEGDLERHPFPAVDITVKSALVFDYDNDGRQDVLLLPIKGTPVFVENGADGFSRKMVGFDDRIEIGMAATAGDYNGDGCLDVFVAQNGDWRAGPPQKVRIETIEQEYDESMTQSLREKPDNGNPNYLYRGTCSSFERVTDAGIEGTRWSVATSMADLTGDGRPDIHVANDFANDTLYVNKGDGRFRKKTIADTDRNGMSSELADVNRDGRVDVFVTNIHFRRKPLTMRALPGMSNDGNNLLINQGNGSFESSEERYGVMDGGWGWASVLVDLNNDGDLDLIHTTRNYVLTTGSEETVSPPSVWERVGPENFSKVDATQRGFEPSNGKGLARADFDLDGDQDLVLADDDGRYRFYDNRVRDGDETAGRNYLQVLATTAGGRPAYGTVVTVTVDGTTRTAVVDTSTDFLSQDSRYLHFGLGDAERASVTVRWPDGSAETVELEANQRVRIGPDGIVTDISPTDGGDGRSMADGPVRRNRLPASHSRIVNGLTGEPVSSTNLIGIAHSV
jgi:hypothetical protein